MQDNTVCSETVTQRAIRDENGHSLHSWMDDFGRHLLGVLEAYHA
jgi:hypothetical protein